MSFVRRCEIPSTRELGTFDELLRKSVGLAQIIVDNARAGELGTLRETQLSLELHQTLEQLDELFGDTSRCQELLATHVANVSGLCEVYYAFLNEFFKVESDNALLWMCYKSILSLIESWTDKSSNFCKKITHSSFFIQHIHHLNELIAEEDSEFLRDVVAANITILYNCVCWNDFPPFYYSHVNWVNVITPWLQSPHEAIRMSCKFLLGYLVPALPEDKLALMNLTEEETACLLAMLTAAIKSPDFTAEGFGYSYSAAELVAILERLVSTTVNFEVLAKPAILSDICVLLNDGAVAEKEAACKLLWRVLDSPELLEIAKTPNVSIVRCLEEIQDSEHAELQTLSRCILILLGKIDKTDQNLLLLTEGCYQYKKYAKCVELGNQILHMPEAQLLKAKALYWIYHQEQRELQRDANSLSQRDFHIKHKTCYSKAREVIGLLGHALDDGFIDKHGGEYSRMLDTAMYDYMFETNNLIETRRCYLCRKRQYQKKGDTKKEQKTKLSEEGFEKTEPTVDDTEAGLTDVLSSEGHDIALLSEQLASVDIDCGSDQLAAVKTEKSKEENIKHGKSKKSVKQESLQASHLFPEAVIRRFVSAVQPAKGARVVEFRATTIRNIKRKDQYQSPGECALFMLCQSCENKLSAHGESQFLKSFFDKIYDVKTPSKPKMEQSITYGKALYQFCVGLIFRLLPLTEDGFVNGEELHQLLTQCRACLVGVDTFEEEKLCEEPEIYLLISPIHDSDDQYGFMNIFLTGSCSQFCGDFSIEKSIDDVSKDHILVHFFLIHMGVINVLVKFSPSANEQIPDGFRLCPMGGTYLVPHDNIRKELLPKGVWTAFQLLAMRSEKQWLESPLVPYTPLQEASKAEADLFGILKSQEHDESASSKEVKQCSPKPKVIDLLPSQFEIDLKNKHTPLVLPDGHSILIHHSHGDQEEGVTALLGIGRSGCYSVNKPYVIYYRYSLGLQVSTAFFVSAEDLSPIEFLPDQMGKLTFQNPEDVLSGFKNIQSVMQCGLEEKGFSSCKSLFDRVKVIPDFPLVDAFCTPCSPEGEDLNRCWYCAYRCDYCFKPVGALAMSIEGPDEMQFKFCSKKCYKISTEPPAATSIYLVSSEGKLINISSNEASEDFHGFRPHCAPIVQNHLKVLHVFVHGRNWAGFSREDEMLLCIGCFPDEKLYVIYWCRSLTGQLCVEFFVSDQLAPEEPLSYIKKESVLEPIVSDSNLQSCLQQAVCAVMHVENFEVISPTLEFYKTVAFTFMSKFGQLGPKQRSDENAEDTGVQDRQESSKENASVQEPHEQSSECLDSVEDDLLSPFTEQDY